jgi:hypothetical protein
VTVAARDPVVLALASISAGAATGAVVITGGLVALRSVQAERGVSPEDDIGFGLLSAALLIGIALGAGHAWRLTRVIEDVWRRGLTAGVAAVLACVLAGIAVPADLVAGRTGLAAYAMVLLASGLWATRRARLAT